MKISLLGCFATVKDLPELRPIKRPRTSVRPLFWCAPFALAYALELRVRPRNRCAPFALAYALELGVRPLLWCAPFALAYAQFEGPKRSVPPDPTSDLTKYLGGIHILRPQHRSAVFVEVFLLPFYFS